MKKILALTLATLLLFAVAACGEKTPAPLDEASAALNVHLASLKAKDFGATDILTGSAYANEDDEMLNAIYAKFDYVITDSVIEGDTATVKVDVTMVDMGAALGAYLAEAMANASDANWDADGSRFMEMLQEDDAATKTHSVSVAMVKDAEGAWTLAEENEDLLNALTGDLLGALEGMM